MLNLQVSLSRQSCKAEHSEVAANPYHESKLPFSFSDYQIFRSTALTDLAQKLDETSITRALKSDPDYYRRRLADLDTRNAITPDVVPLPTPARQTRTTEFRDAVARRYGAAQRGELPDALPLCEVQGLASLNADGLSCREAGDRVKFLAAAGVIKPDDAGLYRRADVAAVLEQVRLPEGSALSFWCANLGRLKVAPKVAGLAEQVTQAGSAKPARDPKLAERGKRVSWNLEHTLKHLNFVDRVLTGAQALLKPDDKPEPGYGQVGQGRFSAKVVVAALAHMGVFEVDCNKETAADAVRIYYAEHVTKWKSRTSPDKDPDAVKDLLKFYHKGEEIQQEASAAQRRAELRSVR